MTDKAYQELTDAENADVLGTLTHEAWIALAVEEVASRYYAVSQTVDRSDPHALARALSGQRIDAELMSIARRSSGSVAGEHRRDLTSAIVGSPQSQTSLSVGVANLPQGGPVIDSKPKRGF